jgi:nucleotide-binding universal stress UspA family protein
MEKGRTTMKFLVAYNGSSESKAALDLAITQASTYNAKVYVITSMEGGHSEKPEDIARVSRELNQVREKLEKAGTDHEVHEMARGLSPGEDIVFFAEDNSIDQIFVGIEKKSRTRKLLLGSTAQFIILKATCPVTTVK